MRLSPVLSTLDLPRAELAAARLDGEVFRLDECYCPVDEIEQPEHRAQALRSVVGERMIAEQRSAAWIWGALATPPRHHQLCTAIGARVRAPGVGWMTVREVVVEPSELTTIAGMQLTTPLRTCVDLARFSPRFGPEEVGIVTALITLGGLGLDNCVDDVNRRRNLPNKRVAVQRLQRAF